MKFKVGDKVLVTAGKDKGKTSVITMILPKKDRAVVKDVNMYTRHIRPVQGRAGEKVRKERPLSPANFAIVNDQGQPDRIGYSVAKDGSKERIFKKTGKVIPEQKVAKK